MNEIEKSVSPLLNFLQQMVDMLWTGVFAVVSIPQAIAISVSLLAAIALHRRIRSALVHLETRFEAGLWRRLLRTAKSISFAIGWVIGLWISLILIGASGGTTTLVKLFASLLNAWVLIRIVSTLIPNAYASTVFAWVAWAVAALNAVGFLDPTIQWLDGVRFGSSSISMSLWDGLQGAIVTGLLVWVAFTLSGYAQAKLEKSSALNPSMRMLLSKLLRIALIALATVFGMQSVGIDLTAFAVFSGALGLGVGLGMQRTVSNLVAGFTMLADRSIKPGDVIEIITGDGPTYGEVKTLGARYVSVKTRAGTETLIPNEILISNPVTNWTFSDKKVRRGVSVGVSYSTDVELAQRLCVEAALNCKRVLNDPKPACLIRGFGNSSVDLELRFWMSDPEDGIANIASEVFLQIWKLFQEHSIEIPFPQQDLHIRSSILTSADLAAQN